MNAEAFRTVGGAPLYVLPLGVTKPPLTLNGRSHWRVRAKRTKELRTVVTARGMQLGMKAAPHLHVVLHYAPADNRDRDPDNLVATLKPCIDALTAKGRDRGWPCLGIVPDDTPRYVSWSPPVIHARDEHGARLWLEVTVLSSAPPPVGEAYGVVAATPPTPHSEGSADA